MVTFNLDNITRQAIGFDNLFNSMLNNNVGDIGYPPYNLIKDKEDTYLLQFALAGFKEKELDVQVKENKPVVLITSAPVCSKTKQYLSANNILINSLKN